MHKTEALLAQGRSVVTKEEPLVQWGRSKFWDRVEFLSSLLPDLLRVLPAFTLLLPVSLLAIGACLSRQGPVFNSFLSPWALGVVTTGSL